MIYRVFIMTGSRTNWCQPSSRQQKTLNFGNGREMGVGDIIRHSMLGIPSRYGVSTHVAHEIGLTSNIINLLVSMAIIEPRYLNDCQREVLERGSAMIIDIT